MLGTDAIALDSLLTPLMGAAICMLLLRTAATLCEHATLKRDRAIIAKLSQRGPASRG